MASVYTQLALELSEMNRGLDEARKKMRDYKSFAEKEGEGIGEALFGQIEKRLKGGGDFFKELVGKFAGPLGAGMGVFGAFEKMKEVTGGFREMQLEATRLGETTDTLQRVGAVAKSTHTSTEGLSKAFLRLEKNMAEGGDEKITQALDRLGLKADELAAMPLDQKIVALAEAFQSARAQGTGVHDLFELLGRGSAELIPLLSKSGEELRKMMDAVKPIDADFVGEMAEIDEQLETAGRKFSKFAKRYWGSIVGIGSFVVQRFQGKSSEKIYEEMGERAQARNMEAGRIAREKEEAAQAIKSAQEQAKAAAEQKQAVEELEHAQKRVADLQAHIHKEQLAAMPEDQRVPALQKDLDAVFDEMQHKGGLFYDASIEGLQKWADAVQQSADKAKAALDTAEESRWLSLKARILEMLQRAQELDNELNKSTAHLREQAAKRAEEEQHTKARNAEEFDKIHEKERRKETELMTPAERLESLKNEFKKVFEEAGLKEQSLGKLKQQALDLEKSGNVEAAKKAHERYENALEMAKEMQSTKGGGFSRAGGIAGAVNLIMGRSANELVLDENKTQSGILRDIRKELSDLNRTIKPGTKPAQPVNPTAVFS